MTKIRSRILKKTFDPAGGAWDSGCTHGKKEHTHMKKTLVIAAAALTLGVLSASAQSNVYSLNIVGYVNVELPTGYNLVANPLDDGNGNVSSNLVPLSLPTGSQVLTYTPGLGYTISGKKASGAWSPVVTIRPGNGFFVRNLGPAVTNTFVGNVAGAVPGSISTNIAVGYNLMGSPYPIGGVFTNMGSNTMNFGDNMVVGSQVLTYANGLGYTTSGKKASGAWSPVTTINVGQGFFIRNLSNAPVAWTQNVGP